VSEIIKQKVYNARVVLMEISPPHLEAFDHVGFLQNTIESIPGLSFANANLYFYFFNPSHDDFFMDEDFWIAREVIGHHEFNDDDELDVFDLEQGDSFKVKIDLDMNGPESFEKICQYEKHFRSEISEKVALAPTWRLSFPWTNTFSGSIYLEFFPKVDG
jgi:hypothetical protein